MCGGPLLGVAVWLFVVVVRPFGVPVQTFRVAVQPFGAAVWLFGVAMEGNTDIIPTGSDTETVTIVSTGLVWTRFRNNPIFYFLLVVLNPFCLDLYRQV